MISFLKDEFDSHILDRNVYKLILTDKVPPDFHLRQAYTNKAVDMITCFAAISPASISFFNREQFNLISTRATYAKPVRISGSSTHTIPSGYTLSRRIESRALVNDSAIIKFIKQLHVSGRYYKDPLIPKRDSFRLYRQWMENSVHHDFADEVLVISKNRIPLAFLSLKIKGVGGFIDLIVVDADYRNMGLGTYLMQEGIRYFQGNNVESVFVTTAGENIPANAFYQKNGFLLHKMELVYHRHFR